MSILSFRQALLVSPGGVLSYDDGTFTRSTEGSMLTGAPTDGSSSFLSWVGTNVRRDEDRGDGAGPLFLAEGSRQNAVIQSRELNNNAIWGAFGTVTPGQADPEAGTAADRINNGAAVIGRYQVVAAAGRVTSGWVRRGAGAGTYVLYQYLNAGSGTEVYGTAAAAFGRVATPYHAGPIWVNVQDTRGPGTHTFSTRAAAAADAVWDLMQTEAGRFPSSAIRTVAAVVTRGADTLTFAPSSVPAWLLTKAGFHQVSPVFADTDLVNTNALWLLSVDGGAAGIRIFRDAVDTRVEALAGGAVVARSAALAFARDGLLGTVTWDAAAGLVRVGGVAGAAGTPWAWSAPVAGLRVGGIYGAASEAFCRVSQIYRGAA